MRVGEAAASVRRRLPAACAGAASFSWNTRSIAQRNADSVLPEPVGATTSACLPCEIAFHAPICASVGLGNAPRNQSCVAGPNRASTSLIRPSCPLSPTSGSDRPPCLGAVERDQHPEDQVEPDRQAEEEDAEHHHGP